MWRPRIHQDTPYSSRHASRPSFAPKLSLLENRGRREGRVQAAPMARQQQKKLAAVTTGLAEHPAFPAQWLYGLWRALPGARAFLPPLPADHLRKLDLSVGRPGPHAFAVRGTSFVAQELRPQDDPRPSHPASNVRDDREAPLISEAGRHE